MDDHVLIMIYKTQATGFLNFHILDMTCVLKDDCVVYIGSP